MKAGLIAFLLMLTLTAPASAYQPNFLEGIDDCVKATIAFTRFAQIATDAQEKDKPAFVAYIQQIADTNEDPEAKAAIVGLGELAWQVRGKSVQATAQAFYGKCYTKLQTKS